MQFKYRARDEKGNLKTGTIESSTKGSALLALQDRGLYVTSISEEEIPFHQRKLRLPQRVSQSDVVVLSRQLSIMLESKMTIAESLRILSKQLEKEGLREKVEDITEKVEGGVPFSEALRAYPKLFSQFYTGMVAAGEVSGKLTESLTFLADQLESSQAFRRKLLGALTYPGLVVIVFGAVLSFMFLYIIPQLMEMIEELEVEVPFLTRAIIAISTFFQNWWWILFLLVIFIIVAFLKFIKTENGKILFDTYFLKIPVIGTLFKKIYLYQFAENFSALLGSALSIVRSLEITENIVSNTIYKTIIADVKKEVKEGREVSKTLQSYPEHFPPLFLQMVYVGEKSGRLEFSLKNAAKFYKEEVERKTDSYVKMIQPLLIIMLGGLVGLLVVSILLPIYQVGMQI